MKKAITLLVSMLVLCFSFGLNAFAYGLENEMRNETLKYKVGDKMPNYKLGTFLEKQGLATAQADGHNCQIFFQLFSLRNSDSDSIEYSVAFPSSKPEGLPYGIFHYQTKTLFLDNRDAATGKNGPDGLIDEISIINTTTNRDAIDDHPYCNKK